MRIEETPLGENKLELKTEVKIIGGYAGNGFAMTPIEIVRQG